MNDPPPTLLDVPDDALLLIANHDLPAALSLRSTCGSLHTRLLEVGRTIAEQRKADAGRSRAEMSLVAMSCKSEIDKAAERAIARMQAAGIQPPSIGGCVTRPAASSIGAAQAASASAAYVAAVHQPAPPPAEAVPPAGTTAAAAAAAPAAASAAPTRRRSSFTGLISKLTVKDVR